MEKVNDSTNIISTTAIITPPSNLHNNNSFQIQVQQDRRRPPLLPLTLIKVQEPRNKIGTATVFRLLFLVHLFLIAILVIFLAIHGLTFAEHRHHFHPKKWFPPLLSATASGGIVALVWLWITVSYPSRVISLAFWLSPLMTCGVGALLLLIGSAPGLAVGVIAIVFAVIQSIYTCWVTPRFDYASRVLSVATAFPPAKSPTLVTLMIIMAVFYTSFIVTGIGGASATASGIDILFILMILTSQAWTMQVIKNTLHVTISRIKFLHFACGTDMEIKIALRDTFKYLMGSVCIGSLLVPVVSVIWGSARGIVMIVGGTDEFLFSCANCYAAVASTLVSHGNRWGFVQVAVYNKGFVQASMDTWEMFRRFGLEPIIETDLTGTFCFLCGMTGGSVSSLVAGSWSLAVHKGYAAELSIYAFLIGYFMTRIAMALPQACVAAYCVSYAENPQNPRFDSTIPDRLDEIQRYIP